MVLFFLNAASQVYLDNKKVKGIKINSLPLTEIQTIVNSFHLVGKLFDIDF